MTTAQDVASDRSLRPTDAVTTRLELYWIPLGAGSGSGARVVRTSGWIYERVHALLHRRTPRPLFHTALVVERPTGRSIIEMTPVPRDGEPSERGVVAGGPVGSSWLGRARIFRYEVRCWSGGVIPDIRFAVDSPVVISTEPEQVSKVLEVVRDVPSPVWGRDPQGLGDMWNSNSVVAWTLERAGLVERAGSPPLDGRAPGWDAGLRAGTNDKAQLQQYR